MWFKNLKIFRLSPAWQPSSDEFEALLAKQAFVDGQFSGEPLNMGWAPFFEEEGTLVHKVENNYLVRLVVEKKLLPTSVINQFAKAKAQEVEEEQGYKVGRKQMKEIKENVAAALRTKAFSIYRETRVWFDLDNHWMIVDTGASSKADEVIGLLAKVLDPLPLLSYMTEKSPTSCMTSWLLDDTAPDGFTVDQDTELKSMTDSRISVRYANHTPEHEELSKQITSGKTCTRLAMTWNDRVSFVLNDAGDVRRVTPLEVLAEARDPIQSDDAIEHFDAEMVLMFGELNALLRDLSEALGGEKRAE
ncbi:recombination-associated protein RdgC [Pelistega europaea]|uniref:Recombination-associated protein RdgC n=1 Tax=Pelistega europaea TaxID=106147 RepID=A0A7Y4LAM0_9BURK|nr:recombination-associated protein RdgC [Pelistega europaea]NOL48996.1 recombination-associated protein RdgC [Pelistega europaea]